MTDPVGDSSESSTQAWGGTDVGLRRERNEDAYCVDDQLGLYIVADGMGGHAGGGLASSMAVTAIVDTIRSLVDEPDATVDPSNIPLQGRDPTSILRYAIQNASQDIYLRSVKEPKFKGMGTTAVVVWIRGRMAYIANVGDSRCYLVRQEGIRQLTLDHSLVGEQMRAGILTEEDARVHRLRNIITRSVGFQEKVEVDIEEFPLRSRDRLLLCSDGLTNMVADDVLCEIVRSKEPAQAGQQLIDLANAAGGDDNITLILARLGALVEEGEGTIVEDEWDDPTVQL